MHSIWDCERTTTTTVSQQPSTVTTQESCSKFAATRVTTNIVRSFHFSLLFPSFPFFPLLFPSLSFSFILFSFHLLTSPTFIHCRSGKFRRSPPPTSSSSQTHRSGYTEKYESKTAQELALEAKQQLISLRGTSKASVLLESFERKRKERVIQAAKNCLEEPNKCQTFATLTSVL